MIYTVGNRKVYDRLFREERGPKKMGQNRETGYYGGWVWATREEAQTQQTLDFQVYGVLADWEKDIVSADHPHLPGMYYLLVESPLVKLD